MPGASSTTRIFCLAGASVMPVPSQGNTSLLDNQLLAISKPLTPTPLPEGEGFLMLPSPPFSLWESWAKGGDYLLGDDAGGSSGQQRLRPVCLA
ncbi:hypothetical protein CCP4SC76_5760007 [Gammaproteobacteria bacterium]